MTATEMGPDHMGFHLESLLEGLAGELRPKPENDYIHPYNTSSYQNYTVNTK